MLNGLRHGEGVYQCANGVSCYTGQWHIGKRQGKVKLLCAWCIGVYYRGVVFRVDWCITCQVAHIMMENGLITDSMAGENGSTGVCVCVYIQLVILVSGTRLHVKYLAWFVPLKSLH